MSVLLLACLVMLQRIVTSQQAAIAYVAFRLRLFNVQQEGWKLITTQNAKRIIL